MGSLDAPALLQNLSQVRTEAKRATNRLNQLTEKRERVTGNPSASESERYKVCDDYRHQAGLAAGLNREVKRLEAEAKGVWGR